MYTVNGAMGNGHGDLLRAMQDYFAISGDWFLESDQQDRIVFCYRNQASESRKQAEQALGKHLDFMVPERSRAQFRKFLENNRYPVGKRSEYYFITDNGRHYVFCIISFGEGGQFQGYRMVARNLSSQLNHRLLYDDSRWMESIRRNNGMVEQDIPAAIRQQELLAALSMSFAQSNDFLRTMEEAFEKIGLYLGADQVYVYRDEPEQEAFSLIHRWRSERSGNTPEDRTRVPYAAHHSDYAQLCSVPSIAVPDIGKIPSGLFREAHSGTMRSFVMQPVYIEERLWGVFGVASSEARAWENSEINLLQTINGIVASAFLRKLVETELAEAFSKLQGVVQNYPGAIWSLDNDLKVTLCEGELVRALGIEPANAVGRSMEDIRLVLGDNADNLLHHTHRTFDKGPQSYVTQVADRYVTCNTSLLCDKKGKVIGQLGVVLDITDIQNMQKKLESAIDEAQKANMAKSEFLSRMSHEIRTPMNAIVGMNAIARGTQEISKIQYCMEKIDVASKQMLEIINNILDMSKIEANKFELTDNEFDFEKMLMNVCNVISVRAEEKRQNFTVDFVDVFDRMVVCDELRLTQVLVNLLVNAVKFTPEQGNVTLLARQHPGDDDRFTLHVEVIDDGIGISDEQQRRLFQSFEQGDSSITRKFGGTGLGLVICKKIVHLMGGEIQVRSEEGKGSTFLFDVPMRWGGKRAHTEQTHTLNKEDIRVMVVDDSEDVRMYFHNILEKFEFACDTVGTGMEAIRCVERAMEERRPYTLIFVDWMMPELDGIETARRIQKMAQGHSIVIMISVADWSDIEREASRIGVDKFLAKPVLPSVLLDSIIEWTGSNAMIREQEGAGADERDWSKRNIMLAEDIDINQEIIVSILADTGINIECVENGKLALERFRSDPARYDAILMDVQMPEMDGLEATRQIRRLPLEQARTVPIIAMTAHAFKADVEGCLAAGMNDHISKPIDLDDLMSKLGMYLERLR